MDLRREAIRRAIQVRKPDEVNDKDLDNSKLWAMTKSETNAASSVFIAQLRSALDHSDCCCGNCDELKAYLYRLDKEGYA